MPRPDPAEPGAADAEAAVLALLREERAAYAALARLEGLTDEQLDRPVSAAHDWSGRDLIAHVIAWFDDVLAVAEDLRTGPSSAARARSRQEFAARGDEINARIQAEWSSLPIAEVRRRLREVPEALRRAVLEAPATHWLGEPDNLVFLRVYTIGHYDDHAADIEAILHAAGERLA